MSRRTHYYGENHLYFLAANSDRHARIFDSDRFKLTFTQTLGELRAELGFRIIGYVLMPEHSHLLIWPSDLANPSQIMQRLSEHTANFVLLSLRRNPGLPWCWKCYTGLSYLQTLHHHAHHRVCQRGGYDMTSGRSSWKSLLTCTTIPSSEGWSPRRETGRGQVGGFTILKAFGMP